MRTTLTVLALALASTAQADIAVQFIEGAPKDRFRITNQSGCPTGPIDVVIDLSASPAGLIFDTTGAGAGVEVFQPFEMVEGMSNVDATNRVSDGDTRAEISIADYPQKASSPSQSMWTIR